MSRPKQCAEVLSRIRETGCSTPGIVFINGKQDTVNEYHTMELPEGWLKFQSDENLGCIGALNKVFELYPNEDWYGFIGDDEILLPDNPQDWDQRLINAAGDWNVSHGWEDLNQGKRAQGYLCIGGKLARAIGYLAIPQCWHWYGLDCMYEWLGANPGYGGGGAIQVKLVPEVRVTHRHAYAGKAPLDECYRLGESRNEEDRKKFWDWIKNEMPSVVERIRCLKTS